jgi:sporulation protein YlmC with PRC-barrel domain
MQSHVSNRSVRAAIGFILATLAVIELSARPVIAQAFDIFILDTKGYRTSKLIGSPVFNERDEKIGSVKEIIMTTAGSFIVAADVGPYVAERSKIVLFPFLRVEIDEKTSKIVARDASRDQLKKMAAFVFPEER